MSSTMGKGSFGCGIVLVVLSLAALAGGVAVSLLWHGKTPEPLTVAQVAPDLPSFGDLASVRSQPVSREVGPEAATVPLDDGVRIVVPAGAFSRPTRLTAAVVDLDLPRLDDGVKQVRAYVVSTADPVDRLGAPVVLEVPRPSEYVTVVERVEGKWRVVPTAAGETTKVEITHFSWRIFAFVEWLRSRTARTNQAIEEAGGVERPMVEGVERQDPWTKAFFGVGDQPSNTPRQSCAEFKTMLKRYRGESHVAFPEDEPRRQLFPFLFPAQPPSKTGGYYWNKVESSQDEIDARLTELARRGRVSPARFLEICIQANGDNIPRGVLAAHNFLKENAYQGRWAFANYQARLRKAGTDEERAAARQKLSAEMEKWGRQASLLEPWREEAVAPEGYYDKMGPVYHVFAAMTVGLWGGRIYGAVAINGESFLRVTYAGEDKSDDLKGRTDDCGYDIAKWILDGMPDDDAEPPSHPPSHDKGGPVQRPPASDGPDLTNTRWLFEPLEPGPGDPESVVPGYLEFFEGKPGGTVRAGYREKGKKFVDWEGSYDGKRVELKAVPRELSPEDLENLKKLGRTGRMSGFGPGDVGTISGVLDDGALLMTGTATVQYQETPNRMGPKRTEKFKGYAKSE